MTGMTEEVVLRHASKSSTELFKEFSAISMLFWSEICFERLVRLIYMCVWLHWLRSRELIRITHIIAVCCIDPPPRYGTQSWHREEKVQVGKWWSTVPFEHPKWLYYVGCAWASLYLSLTALAYAQCCWLRWWRVLYNAHSPHSLCLYV